MQEFVEHGAHVVLWTCREGEVLDTAVASCKKAGIHFQAVNENAPCVKKYLAKYSMLHKLAGRKIMASIYVDDAAPGSIESFLNMNAKEVCESCEKSFT